MWCAAGRGMGTADIACCAGEIGSALPMGVSGDMAAGVMTNNARNNDAIDRSPSEQ